MSGRGGGEVEADLALTGAVEPFAAQRVDDADGTPGSGRPIDPGFTAEPGVLPTAAVISVWP